MIRITSVSLTPTINVSGGDLVLLSIGVDDGFKYSELVNKTWGALANKKWKEISTSDSAEVTSEH